MNAVSYLRRFYIVLLCITVTSLAGCGLLVSSHHRIEDYTPVFAAADACNLPEVRQAVDQDSNRLIATEWDNATLLHNAVGHNCVELAAYLLDKGANPNAVRTDGVTPLHLAAERGNIQIMELLLKHGANINAIDATGWTPLDRAVKWDRADAAAYLRQHGGHESKTGG
jgi:ankyrin repeat protein